MTVASSWIVFVLVCAGLISFIDSRVYFGIFRDYSKFFSGITARFSREKKKNKTREFARV